MNVAVAVASDFEDVETIEDRLSDILAEEDEVDIWVTGASQGHDTVRRWVATFKGTPWRVRLKTMHLTGRPALVLVYGNVQDPAIDPAVIEWMATSAKVETHP